MEKAREMGKRGRRRVEKYFSWDKRLSNNYPTTDNIPRTDIKSNSSSHHLGTL